MIRTLQWHQISGYYSLKEQRQQARPKCKMNSGHSMHLCSNCIVNSTPVPSSRDCAPQFSSHVTPPLPTKSITMNNTTATIYNKTILLFIATDYPYQTLNQPVHFYLKWNDTNCWQKANILKAWKIVCSNVMYEFIHS